MVAFTKKLFLLALGWFFVLLGIIGLFLPFLQGILFILIGLGILSKESKMARALLIRLKKRCPGSFQKISELRQRARTRFRRWVS